MSVSPNGPAFNLSRKSISAEIMFNNNTEIIIYTPKNRLSVRLESLGIMGTLIKAPLKSLSTIVLRWSEKLKEGSQLAPHDAERRQALGQLHV